MSDDSTLRDLFANDEERTGRLLFIFYNVPTLARTEREAELLWRI
jgi:hypothetical protein